jgi:soluble cytochrome b562
MSKITEEIEKEVDSLMTNKVEGSEEFKDNDGNMQSMKDVIDTYIEQHAEEILEEAEEAEESTAQLNGDYFRGWFSENYRTWWWGENETDEPIHDDPEGDAQADKIFEEMYDNFSDYASDLFHDAKDAADLERDPYSYYGVSRSDFH